MRVASLILLAMPADACLRRLMQVCSSSQPDAPGKVSFYFGVTECWKYNAPGSLHIKTPTGVVLEGKWNDWRCTHSCNGKGEWTTGGGGTGPWTHGNQCSQGQPPNPRSGDKGQQFIDSVKKTYLLPPTADVTCYKEKQGGVGVREQGNWWYPGGYKLYQSQVLQPEDINSHTCYGSSRIYAWFKVTVSEATTGQYEVWTTNSKNRHFVPGNDEGSPCTISNDRHFMMSLSVAAFGKSCAPFADTIANGEIPNSCKAGSADSPAISNGFLCDVKCQKTGFFSVGQLSCDDGKWLNTYQCTDKTCRSTAENEFSGMAGVAGAACGGHTAVGTKCAPTCSLDGWWVSKDAEVTCQPDGKWAGAGKCIPPGDDVVQEQAQFVEFYPETPGTDNPLVLSFEPPKRTHTGSKVQYYKIQVVSGQASGLPSRWNHHDGPSPGLKFSKVGTTPLSITVDACNENHCEPGEAVSVIPKKTDRASKICYTNIDDFALLGSAKKITNDELELTPDRVRHIGGAFSSKTIDPSNFEAEFEIFVGDKERGTSGMTFTVADVARWNGQLGKAGGFCMGSCGIEGFTVEFDTYEGFSDQDTNKDHVAVWKDGIGAATGKEAHSQQGGSTAGHRISKDFVVGPNGQLENNQWHKVEVLSRNGKLRIFVNTNERVNIDYKPDFTEGRFGFTGATGFSSSQQNHNRHAVRTARVCVPRGSMGVSGDPFVVNAKGDRVQFFLPLHQEVMLLQCKNMQLFGRAFDSGISGDHQQWFNHFRLTVDGNEELVVEVAKNMTEISDEADIAANTGGVNEKRMLSTIKVTVEGSPMEKTGAIGLESASLIAVWKAEHSETIQYSLGSTVLQIKSAVAQKFPTPGQQNLYTHLDLRFLELKTDDCQAGVLAEIWGGIAMSQGTAAMLEPPQ